MRALSLFRRRLLVVGLAGLLVALSSCTAPGAWTVEPVPTPLTEQASWDPAGVSCATATSCVVVGGEIVPGAQSGPRFALAGAPDRLTPGPTGARGRLDTVSCGAAEACLAVGIESGTINVPIAHRRQGGTWAEVTAPPSPVTDLACIGTDWCLAVGPAFPTDANATNPVAYTWNGSAWTDRSPTGDTGLQTLAGVACTSPTRCVAAANRWDHTAVMLRWDGTTWTTEDLPEPPVSGRLGQVACRDEDRCVVVGSSSIGQRLAYARRDGAWTRADPPEVVGGTGDLNDVACAPGGACVAVGSTLPGTGALTPTVLRWDGTSWTAVTPAFAGTVRFTGVSCPDARTCVAVGLRVPTVFAPFDVVVAQGLDTWRLLASPPIPKIGARMRRIACVDTTWCMGAGDHTQLWDGTSWRALPTTDPTSAANVSVLDLSCTSRTFCVALAGRPDALVGWAPLLFRWDGTRFRAMALPDLGLTSWWLFQVSCAGERFCMTTGINPWNGQASAHVWNGAWWTATAVLPFSSTAPGALSCWSATGCMVVGQTRAGFALPGATRPAPPGPEKAVAARWDGTTWTDTAVPDLPDTNRESFTALSCPAADFCAAAGEAGNRRISTNPIEVFTDPLAASWDGTAWKLARLPRPGGRTGASYSSVSCADPTWCVAVGSSQYSSPTDAPRRPTAAVWHEGAWNVSPAFPTPAEGELVLTSVSCRQRRCLALAQSPEVARYALSATPPR